MGKVTSWAKGRWEGRGRGLEERERKKEEERQFKKDLARARKEAARKEKLERARGKYDIRAARRQARVSDIASGGELKYKRRRNLGMGAGAVVLGREMIKAKPQRMQAKASQMQARSSKPRRIPLAPRLPMSFYIPKPITGYPRLGKRR